MGPPGEPTRFGCIGPRASGEKRIIAFERDDDAPIFEQLEDVRAALTRGFCHRHVPFLSGSNGSAP